MFKKNGGGEVGATKSSLRRPENTFSTSNCVAWLPVAGLLTPEAAPHPHILQRHYELLSDKGLKLYFK